MAQLQSFSGHLFAQLWRDCTRVDAAFQRRKLCAASHSRDRKITLNGELDRPYWQRAPVSANFIENKLREKQAAQRRTKLRVLFDKDAIYIGDVATDTLARSLLRRVTLNTRPHQRAELECKASDFRRNDIDSKRWRLHERTMRLVGIRYVAAHDTLRLIAQLTRLERNATMYALVVTPKSQPQAIPLLYSPKCRLGREFNLAVTQGNERVHAQLHRATTQVLAKLSPAFSL